MNYFMLFLSVSVTKICIKYMYTYISKQKQKLDCNKFICIQPISNFIFNFNGNGHEK